MIPAFTEGGKERENLSTLARSCAGVGSAIITIITMKCVYVLGQENERMGFKWFALIVSLLFVLFTLVTCMVIKEKSTVDVDSPSVGEMFRALLRNDQAMTVVITIVLINCSLYITSNLLIYFFKYDFGTETWYNSYTLFNTFGGAIQILSMMIFSGAQKVYQCHTGILCKHYSGGFRIHSASGIVFCQYVKFIIAIDSRFSDLYSLWDADGTYHGISGQYGGLWGNEERPPG